jgi:4-diphosphocytidyl-2-C-methyl-D-erythritol kinase
VTNSCPPFPASSSHTTVLAPAKVNLILRILDRRSDGFHNLWSLMQTVELVDEVSIRLNQGHADIRLECDAQSLSVDHTNLVYRAALTVLRQSQRTAGLDIVLKKRIPMGAGLGGGSSDAAATIVGLNRLLNLGWSPHEMAAVGEGLGSDVPFFFFAPSAIVSGRGEQVQPVRIAGTRWVVLVNPGFPVETKWAYHQLSSTRPGIPTMPDALAHIHKDQQLSWDQVSKEAHNDFEGPVFSVHPVLREVKMRLLAAGAETVLLSGSGATVFGLFQQERQARQSAEGFRTNPDLKVFVVPAGSGPLCWRT